MAARLIHATIYNFDFSLFMYIFMMKLAGRNLFPPADGKIQNNNTFQLHNYHFMKKMICPFSIAFLFFSTTIAAQNVNMSADSVTLLLCKKWEVAHAMIGSIKMGSIPGVATPAYEFNADKTFIMTGSGSARGTWSFYPAKKFIMLTMRGRPSTTITSLTPAEFTILLEAKRPSPNEPVEETKLVYKPKNK